MAVMGLTLAAPVPRAETNGAARSPEAGLGSSDKAASYSMSSEDRNDLLNPARQVGASTSAPDAEVGDNQKDDDSIEITPVETEPDTEQSPVPKKSPEPVEIQPDDAGDTGIL